MTKEEKAQQYYSKAKKANQRGDYKEARNHLEKTIELKSNWAEAHYNLATLLWQHFQEYEKARQYFEKAIELKPDFVEVYEKLAFILTEHFQEYGTARKYYENIIDLSPDDANAYYSVAVISAKYFSEPEKAKEYFEKAIELKPDYAEAYVNLALLLQQHFQEYEKAKEYYEKVIELKPDLVEAYLGLAFLLEKHFQEYEKAKKYYEKLIELKSDDAVAYVNLAFLLENHFQEYDKAKEYYEKAIELKPDYAEAYRNLALLLEKHFQEYEKAKKYYEKAIELKPDDAGAYVYLALLLEKHFQDYILAEDYLKKAIVLYSKNPSQREKAKNELKRIESYESISTEQITAVTIENFRIFNRLEAALSSGINILLAKNGYGKTTFLQALTLACLYDKNEDIGEFARFLHFDSEQATLVTTRKQGQTTTLINQFEKISHYEKVKIRPPVCLAYGANIFTRYEAYNYDSIIAALRKGTKKWYHTTSVFDDFTDTFFDPLIVLNKLADYDDESEVEQIKNFIVEKLNSLIPDFKIVTKGKNRTFYFSDNSNYLTTKDLSEGYRSNIILLNDIIMRVISVRKTLEYSSLNQLFKKITGLIVIDEFDRHLHPSWQKNYAQNLQNLLPSMQLVLTTHNPVSILGRKTGEVQELYFDSNEKAIKIKPLPETETLDAGMILLKHFGLNSIVSNNLQQKIDRFYELKTKNTLNNTEQHELQTLENEIANTYVGANIHDYRFLIFIKFLKERGYDFRERLNELVLTKDEIRELEKEFEEYYEI